jgi:hypothetical protein
MKIDPVVGPPALLDAPLLEPAPLALLDPELSPRELEPLAALLDDPDPDPLVPLEELDDPPQAATESQPSAITREHTLIFGESMGVLCHTDRRITEENGASAPSH